MQNKETEKKFLIKYPSKELLEGIEKKDISEITQTYLISEKGITLRLRKRVYESGVKYYKTEKIRISDMTALENEIEIDEEAYNNDLKFADPKRRPIEKTRLLMRNGKHVFEIDIYPFWQDRAIMEVELESEDEEFCIPDSVEVIADVTGDARYKNASLARVIPE